MKKKYISIIIAVIVIIAIGVGFFVYKNNTQNKGIQKANELIKEREYDKALASFELVLDDHSNNQDAIKGKEMLEDYINANKKFNDGDLEESKKLLSNMPSEYSNYKELKEDVDSLKDKINKAIDDNKEIDKSIDNIRDLINKDEYTKAKKAIESLQNKNLDENQKKTLEDLKGRVDSELEKSDENSSSSNKENSNNLNSNNSNTNNSNTNNSSTSKSDMALARIKYLNRLNDIQNQIDSMEPGDTTAEMNENADAAYKAWDGALNDIYQYLKANLPSDEFKPLEKEEIQWIKQKEENAKQAADKYRGGTAATSVYLGSLGDDTKNRCYELVNEYMN
ncbi:lysozyme inhibitor LprI family protein [Clostridium sp.]|uniref:lysozyme inhibitor LprI family protein n=1 Tax=Clostridium sp. TaxID=1506 RepID=UPI002A90CEC8|nr:lysozyme inhibitor LprI family protein [Clostridium sp.]MDY6013051.1 lysozyme inhibitor LprI family protein [Clostridium sp.]